MKRPSKSGRVTPRQDKLEGIKDFSVAYKKLTNNLLKQLMSEQLLRQANTRSSNQHFNHHQLNESHLQMNDDNQFLDQVRQF
jgi:hypothetical protein